MTDILSRTALLIGTESLEILKNARVAVFGIGGVGGYTAEALARTGVGTIDVIDSDVISKSNINRQIYALHSTVGRFKVDVAKERINDINPSTVVNTHNVFYTRENADIFDFSSYDYIVDAIDTVSGKLSLVEEAHKSRTPIISSMGAGNKLDPCAFEITDIYKTSVCPLAKVMRRELKKMGIPNLKVVYSKETPLPPHPSIDFSAITSDTQRRHIPGSCSFVPSVVGLIIAGEVIKDLI